MKTNQSVCNFNKFQITLKRRFNYYFSKGLLNFSSKLRTRKLVYAVFRPLIRIRNKDKINQLFNDYLIDNLIYSKYLKFFNMEGIYKKGRYFHIDFICDSTNLTVNFFTN